jgi:4-hydroxy-tetrahydrodipicolinate synthase
MQIANFPPAPLIVAPTPTPFQESGQVDFGAMNRNIERWLKTSLSGFVLNTENGEEGFLSDAERLQLVQEVAGQRQNRLLIAGVDHPSSLETLRLAELYANAGADLIRLRIPRLTLQRDEYFQQTLPRMPVPVMLIHQMAPGQFLSQGAGPAATPEMIGEWSRMENVLGYIASADMRFESRVRHFIPHESQFWTANGSLILSGILAGANGACMMLANLFPNQARQIFEQMAQGQIGPALEVQKSLVAADWEVLSRRAAGLKAALRELGFELSGPRCPQLPCTPNEVAAIRAALENVLA